GREGRKGGVGAPGSVGGGRRSRSRGVGSAGGPIAEATGPRAPRAPRRRQAQAISRTASAARPSARRSHGVASGSRQGSGPRLGRGGTRPRAFSPFTTGLAGSRAGKRARSAG